MQDRQTALKEMGNENIKGPRREDRPRGRSRIGPSMDNYKRRHTEDTYCDISCCFPKQQHLYVKYSSL